MGKRILNRFSAKEVERLKTPGRHSDGGGLYLAIDESGRRRWIFMYVRRGRRVELGLGGGRDLLLAAARTEATALRAMLASGEDPKAARAKEEVPTFGESADAYVETMQPSWRNPKHAAQWTMTLKTYAKSIRNHPIDEITTQDVLDILQLLWKRVPETAKRLRGRIENVLDAAKAKGQRSGENPARWRGHLDQLLPKRQQLTRGHHVALPYEGVPAFMEELRTRTAVAARALEFTILTACRTSEVLGAKWDEIDLEKCVWTIPANRMKAARRTSGAIISALLGNAPRNAVGRGREPGARPAPKSGPGQERFRVPRSEVWEVSLDHGHGDAVAPHEKSPSMAFDRRSGIGPPKQQAFRMKSARWPWHIPSPTKPRPLTGAVICSRSAAS